MVRRLWASLKRERPVTLALLMLMGVVMTAGGAAMGSTTGSAPARWLSVGLVVAGLLYVLVFAGLWVRAIRRRGEQPVPGAPD